MTHEEQREVLRRYLAGSRAKRLATAVLFYAGAGLIRLGVWLAR